MPKRVTRFAVCNAACFAILPLREIISVRCPTDESAHTRPRGLIFAINNAVRPLFDGYGKIADEIGQGRDQGRGTATIVVYAYPKADG